AWPMLRLRQCGRVTAMSLSCAVTVAGVYAGYGIHALRPLSSASKLVSVPSIWDLPIPSTAICALWPVLLALLVWMLDRRIGFAPHERAGRAALIVTAWMFAAPWVMPWYSAPGWVALGLSRRSALTWL